jgi:hypothetical protein
VRFKLRKNSINKSNLEKDWERLNGDSDRKSFIQNRIESFIMNFEVHESGSIKEEIYNDIDILIHITTSSGILPHLDKDYTNKLKKLIKLRKNKPAASFSRGIGH